MKPIRILPKTQLQEIGENYAPSLVRDGILDNTHGFVNAKAAISYLIQEFGLVRSDEVYISTTSDLSYVSSCVTCTVFNFCKPSRVISESTKMIYVIHEFGILNERVFELKKLATELKIPLVEDIAHSFNSYSNGIRLGEIGDFGIYSLPKFLPVSSGGLLSTQHAMNVLNPYFSESVSLETKSVFDRYSGDIKRLSKMRYEVYRDFEKRVKIEKKLYDVKEGESPYLIAFETNKAHEIASAIRSSALQVELFPMHRNDIIAIPTNSFISKEQIEVLSNLINSVL